MHIIVIVLKSNLNFFPLFKNNTRNNNNNNDDNNDNNDNNKKEVFNA